MNPVAGQPVKPNYSPNVENQTVSFGGAVWKGNPGSDWSLDHLDSQATNYSSLPGKQDINPATGQRYDVNPQTGVPDDNYWATVAEPQLKSSANGLNGVLGSTGGAGAPGAFNLVDATNSAYNSPEILAAQASITDRQKALALAQSNINDNPFYSEATRVGKSEKLSQKANADIQIQQNILADLKSTAAIKVQAALGQYNIENQAYQQKLDLFQNLVNMGALDNANSNDLAGIAVQTGIPVSMLQSIQSVSVKKNNPVDKPQITTATDNEGNLTIVAVDPTTGAVIQQTSIAGVGKAAKGSTGGGTSTSDTAQNTANLTQSAKNGITLKSLVNAYQSVLSVDQIYAIYNQYSTNGKAKETLAEVKQGKYKD